MTSSPLPEDLAREIVDIENEIGPLLRRRSNEAAVCALLRLAAHHNVHASGTEGELVALARWAHASSVKIHARCKVGGT